MVSSFLVLLICFSFIPIYASNNPISKDSNEKLDSSDSACYLDFEDFLSSEDNFICNAYYYYDDIPIISSSGNIEYEILDETHSWARIRIYLAKGEGRLCLLLSSKTMSNSLYIYSSEGMDGKYGVSSYSMDNAKRLVHNLDNQEYMDNDEIPATYVPMPDNSKREEKNRNYTGSGRVYGQLKWTDDNNVVHPLVGIKVKLTFQDSYNSVYQYTDNNGNYDITFGNIVGYTNFECVLHIYTVNNYVVVKDNIGNIYEYVQVLPMSNNSTYQYNHTFDSFTEAYDQQGHLLHQPTFLLGGIQIYEAMYYYSNYAVSLANDTNIPKCYVHYPTARHPSTHNQLDYCFYNNDDNIYLCSESFRNIEKHDCYNGLGGHYPYVEGSWDVIGHEYGHHIQKCYFFQEAGGNHSFGSNCIYKWMFDHCSSSITDKDLYNAKKEGCWLGKPGQLFLQYLLNKHLTAILKIIYQP